MPEEDMFETELVEDERAVQQVRDQQIAEEELRVEEEQSTYQVEETPSGDEQS